MRGTTGRHLRVVANAAVAVAVSMGAAAVLLTGCGKTVVAGQAGPGQDPAPPGTAQPCPGTDPAAPQAAPTLIDDTPANTPEGERLSQAIGAQGYGAFADVYSTQMTDHPAGRVALCVTDLARGRLLVAAAHAADPQADPARADLYLSPYAQRTLQAAGDKVIRLEAGFPIYSVSGSHGAAVEVTTTEEGAASAAFKARLEKATGGIPVTVTKGPQPLPALDAPKTTAP